MRCLSGLEGTKICANAQVNLTAYETRIVKVVGGVCQAFSRMCAMCSLRSGSD